MHGGASEHTSGTLPVGWFTALLPWLGLFAVLNKRKHSPALMERAFVATLVMIPFTMFVGDQPYNCIWWDIAILGFAGWASEADERTRR